MISSFRLTTKINSVALYANAILNVEATSDSNFTVEFDDVDDKWRVAINFAVQYFFEHYRKGFHVKVDYLHTMIIDSSQMTVVYVIVKCLSDALGFKKELITISGTGKPEFIMLK